MVQLTQIDESAQMSRYSMVPSSLLSATVKLAPEMEALRVDAVDTAGCPCLSTSAAARHGHGVSDGEAHAGAWCPVSPSLVCLFVGAARPFRFHIRTVACQVKSRGRGRVRERERESP